MKPCTCERLMHQSGCEYDGPEITAAAPAAGLRASGAVSEQFDYQKQFRSVLKEHHEFMNGMLEALDLEIDEDGEFILDQIVTTARTQREALAASEAARAALVDHLYVPLQDRTWICRGCSIPRGGWPNPYEGEAEHYADCWVGKALAEQPAATATEGLAQRGDGGAG